MALPPLSELLDLLPDNSLGEISAEDMRNIVTVLYDGVAAVEGGGGTGGGVPVGCVIAYPLTTAVPVGFLECAGQILLQADYPALFSAIGVTYGQTLPTNFKLPDYRGRFLRGVDGGSGNDPDASLRTNRGDGVTGNAVGTQQLDEFASHTHGTAADKLVSDTGGAGGLSGGTLTRITVPNSGGNETRPKNIYVKWIIRALPIIQPTFKTPELPFTGGFPQLFTYPHGLGVKPTTLNLYLVANKNIIDGEDVLLNLGDVIYGWQFLSGVETQTVLGVFADSTNVYLGFDGGGSFGIQFAVPRDTGYPSYNFSPNDFNFYAVAGTQ